MFKKFFLILFLIFFSVLTFSGFCFAQKELEISYPEIPGFIRPTTVKALLPEYIKYVFALALMVAGLITFGSLIYGGARYLTSAGSPAALADARDQIFAAILGLVILLCSYLILTTLNPQLVLLRVEREPTISGIVIYKDERCGRGAGEDPNYFSETFYKKLESEGRAMRINTSIATLSEFLESDEVIKSIYFFESADNLRVLFYDRENWEEDGIIELISDAEVCAVRRAIPPAGCPGCPNGWKPGSIGLFPQAAGIYLCDRTYSGDVCGTETNPGNEKFLSSSTALLPAGFNDNVRGLRILNKPPFENGVVLHEAGDFLGKGELFLESEPNLAAPRSGSYRTRIMNSGVSSATVFSLAKEGRGEVIFYEAVNQSGDYYKCNPSTGSCCPFNADGSSKGSCTSAPRCQKKDGSNVPNTMCVGNVTTNAGIPGDAITSIAFGNSNYMAILFDGANYQNGCQVFTDDDGNFRDDQIGRCGCIWGTWGCDDCLSSFILLPIRK